MGFFFIGFFLIISLILRVVFILFDIFIIYFPRNVSFFINHYINAVNNSSKSFIVTLICFVVGRITKGNSFICSGFMFAKLFIIIFNIAFASKNFEMLYQRSLTIPEFMRSLSDVHSDIFFVENNNRIKCSFTLEGCGSSRLIKNSTSHLLNSSVHPFHHSILLRSPSCREFPSYSMFFIEIEIFI